MQSKIKKKKLIATLNRFIYKSEGEYKIEVPITFLNQLKTFLENKKTFEKKGEQQEQFDRIESLMIEAKKYDEKRQRDLKFEFEKINKKFDTVKRNKTVKLKVNKPDIVKVMDQVKTLAKALDQGGQTWFSTMDIFNSQSEFDYKSVMNAFKRLNDSGFLIRSSETQDSYQLTKFNKEKWRSD
jgi:hypothetical protein